MTGNGGYKLLYKVGCAIRGTHVSGYLDELNRSQWWGIDRHRDNQLEKLKKLIGHADTHCPFYSAYFRQSGFDPKISSFADLEHLPPVDKQTLAANSHRIENRIQGERLVFSKSSGTTGAPLAFRRSASWDAQHRAAVARGLGWYGVQPWSKSGIIWGIPSGTAARWKARAGDFLINRVRQRSFDLSRETLEDFYRRLKGAEYLEGYPSLIYEFARYINDYRAGENGLSFLAVKGTSEKIHASYQDEAVKAFGKRITGEYGAGEAGIISFECPDGTHHVNMEHVFIEIVADEILVTNLLSFSFPIIRYKLGDYVKLGDGYKCSCGRESLIIDDVVGRVGKKVFGKDGLVYPSMTVDYIIKEITLKTNLVRQCQVLQREKGRLTFYVVVRPGATSDEKATVDNILGDLTGSYYGNNIDHRIEYVDTIPHRAKKMLEFVSEIDET